MKTKLMRNAKVGSPTNLHATDCAWHVEQYDHECTCDARKRDTGSVRHVEIDGIIVEGPES